MTTFKEWMDVVGTAVDARVAIVVIGAMVAAGRFLFAAPPPGLDGYRYFRQNLGRAILLGLEFLVAGDIIRTVVVAPTLMTVIVLALIVLIRTFLSMALKLEIEGPLALGAAPAPPPHAPTAAHAE